MKLRSILIISSIILFSVGIALGAHYMRIPSAKGRQHIENLPIKEVFSSGQLTFRAENKETKAVLSIYESSLSPDAALREIIYAMTQQGWLVALSTQSMAIFEGKKGKCAAAQAYISQDGTTTASVIMQR